MNESRYLRSAVEGATSVGLVTMLYDRLVADLQRATDAIRQHDDGSLRRRARGLAAD